MDGQVQVQVQVHAGAGHYSGQDTVAKASRAYDLPPSEVEKWIDAGKRGMENALRANPQDVKEQYE